jgi:hypothetical protein
MSSWTIRRKFRSLLAAAFVVTAGSPAAAALPTDPQVMLKNVGSTFAQGARNGWHYADEVTYFSAVLDAGRAFEFVRRDDPESAVLKGQTLDLAVKLNYDPLVNRDAALWYVHVAAAALTGDPVRGEQARVLIAKLDAEEGDPARLAADADADATANAAAYPGDAGALVDQVDADLRAYAIAKDPHFRSLALIRAAQPRFPIGLVPDDTGTPLWAAATAAQRGEAGYSDVDRSAARAMASHKISSKGLKIIGRVLSHDALLVITAPADEYFGQTKLSPLGVRNEIVRIGRYLDAGWGERMTHDALYVIDALDDWRHQYPRDYELPRLLLQSYKMLARIDGGDARTAASRLRRVLTIEYEGTHEARSLLSS